MNKVFLETYWIMSGKWGSDKPPLVSTAWLTSVLPPFYKGYGIGFRFGPYAVRLGVCHPRMPVTVDDYMYVGDMDENLEALVGYEMADTNREIRKWASSKGQDKKAEEADTPMSSEERSEGSASATSPTSSKDISES